MFDKEDPDANNKCRNDSVIVIVCSAFDVTSCFGGLSYEFVVDIGNVFGLPTCFSSNTKLFNIQMAWIGARGSAVLIRGATGVYYQFHLD